MPQGGGLQGQQGLLRAARPGAVAHLQRAAAAGRPAGRPAAAAGRPRDGDRQVPHDRRRLFVHGRVHPGRFGARPVAGARGPARRALHGRRARGGRRIIRGRGAPAGRARDALRRRAADRRPGHGRGQGAVRGHAVAPGHRQGRGPAPEGGLGVLREAGRARVGQRARRRLLRVFARPGRPLRDAVLRGPDGRRGDPGRLVHAVRLQGIAPARLPAARGRRAGPQRGPPRDGLRGDVGMHHVARV
mmetsp:Transcript_29206/g.90367  ORF Transcript_29206/g.90367 Transcript_29206/m.90367 type:complete len:245 (-) Transcript_29206:1393-2127(-)